VAVVLAGKNGRSAATRSIRMSVPSMTTNATRLRPHHLGPGSRQDALKSACSSNFASIAQLTVDALSTAVLKVG
jgi:hypothetical protein